MNQQPIDLSPFREIVGPSQVKEDPDYLSECAIDGMVPKAVRNYIYQNNLYKDK